MVFFTIVALIFRTTKMQKTKLHFQLGGSLSHYNPMILIEIALHLKVTKSVSVITTLYATASYTHNFLSHIQCNVQ